MSHGPRGVLDPPAITPLFQPAGRKGPRDALSPAASEDLIAWPHVAAGRRVRDEAVLPAISVHACACVCARACTCVRVRVCAYVCARACSLSEVEGDERRQLGPSSVRRSVGWS